MDYANRQIGFYRALSKIATGGCGEIWRGEVVADRKRKVALKILRQDVAAGHGFDREYDLLCKARHSGIISVLGRGKHEGVPYMVMELFDGRTLKSLIMEKSQIINAHACDIMRQLAGAVHHLHVKGIVHRDIKPENVMVNEAGEIRLIDFSIAQTGWQRWLSRFFKRPAGSPSYMAPEVAAGKPSSPQSDIYSLGATIFEMLAGRAPFIGNTIGEILAQHKTAQPPKLSKFNPRVTPAFDNLLAKLLSKAPELRPLSVEQFFRKMESSEVFLDS